MSPCTFGCRWCTSCGLRTHKVPSILGTELPYFVIQTLLSFEGQTRGWNLRRHITSLWLPLAVLCQLDDSLWTIDTVFDKGIPWLGVSTLKMVHCLYSLQCLLSKRTIKEGSPVIRWNQNLAILCTTKLLQLTWPPARCHPGTWFWTFGTAV